MPKPTQQKSIFITGAASGIGAETARYFARKGWFTGLYDIDETGLKQLAQEIGPENCHSKKLDVRLREDWAAAVSGFTDVTESQLHVLFNNAGIGRSDWFEDVAPEDNDAIIDINLKGVLHGVQACLPFLKHTKGARTINTASTAGVLATPRLATYSASKFAVRGLTEAPDLEFQHFDIRVLCLLPWFIDTGILDSALEDGVNRSGKDELEASGIRVYPTSLAAETVWKAVHGKARHYTVGQEAGFAQLGARLFPGLLRNRLLKGLPDRNT